MKKAFSLTSIICLGLASGVGLRCGTDNDGEAGAQAGSSNVQMAMDDDEREVRAGLGEGVTLSVSDSNPRFYVFQFSVPPNPFATESERSQAALERFTYASTLPSRGSLRIQEGLANRVYSDGSTTAFAGGEGPHPFDCFEAEELGAGAVVANRYDSSNSDSTLYCTVNLAYQY